MAASPPQVQVLRGLLRAHVPDFQQVLAVVESPVVRSTVRPRHGTAVISALRRRATGQQETLAEAALERAVTVLRNYQRAGLAVIPVGDVLRLLDTAPRDDPAPQEPPQQQPPRDPTADPLTGARWAGPPGSKPPAA